MKKLLLSLLLAGVAAAPAYAAAPSGSSGECKDGSYTSADSKRGACSGHGGVKDWYGKDKAAKRSDQSESRAEARIKKGEARAEARGEKQTAAAGGSSGRVWVNNSSRVYHCSGDRWYGKTEQGEYMSEAAAKANGNRPDHGKACSER